MATATDRPATPPAVIPQPVPVASPPPSARPYRLSMEQYERMAELGILGKRDRVFLWKGQLVAKMTIHPPHALSQTSMNAILVRLMPPDWHVRQDLPLRLGDDSMPEPDLVLARGTPRVYGQRHPNPADLALVIEVSDSSLAADRGEMLQEYARHGVPVYWIVNIPQRCVEVYTEPSGPAEAPSYCALRTYGPGESLPLLLDGREVGRITVNDVLP